MITLISVSSETVMLVKSVSNDTCFISDDVLFLEYISPGV